MKVVFVLSLAFLVLLFGASETFKQIKINKTLEEALKIISLFKNEIRFRQSDFSQLLDVYKNENFKYIKINGHFKIEDVKIDEPFAEDFNDFLGRVGTTDLEGQLSLCDEFLEKFTSYLIDGKEKEKNNGRINLALSALGSLSVIVVFL